MRAQLRCWLGVEKRNGRFNTLAELYALALLLFIVFPFFFLLLNSDHIRSSSKGEIRLLLLFSLALLAVALAYIRSNCCPAWAAACMLSSQISLSFLMRSCVPALAIVGQPSRYMASLRSATRTYRVSLAGVVYASSTAQLAK